VSEQILVSSNSQMQLEAIVGNHIVREFCGLPERPKCHSLAAKAARGGISMAYAQLLAAARHPSSFFKAIFHSRDFHSARNIHKLFVFIRGRVFSFSAPAPDKMQSHNLIFHASWG
jgi:hypothetical protein